MKPMAVLYVDDDKDIRHIVNLSLSLALDVTCRVASSGAEALRILDDWAPDVAVLDVMMPEMDGPTLLQHIRARPDTAGLPVLFLTARGRPSDIEGYHDLGAAGVISKPFDPITLADEIRTIVAESAASARP